MATRRVGPLPPCGFMVQTSTGGQLPLNIEKRAKGKKVTVISGVQGNAKALCTTLTTLLGIGGTIHTRGQFADVEVQGEQVPRLERVLEQLGCIRGPGGRAVPASRQPAIVAERACGYDDFLRREAGGGRGGNLTLRPAAAALASAEKIPEPPEDAPCRAWHGYWIYCAGKCERPSALGGVWEDVAEANAALAARRAGRWGRAQTKDELQAGLRSLGMLAEIGPSIKQWLEQQAAEALRKQSLPATVQVCRQQTYVQAGSDETSLTCDECGASFSMKRTLRMHKQQHQRDRENAAASLTASWTSSKAAPAQSYWPPSTTYPSGEANQEELEQAPAAYALQDDAAAMADAAWAAWEAMAPGMKEEELDGYEAPAPAPSLASWIDQALVSRPDKKSLQKRAQVPSGPPPKPVQCPLCNRFFTAAEIEFHASECGAEDEAFVPPATMHEPASSSVSVTPPDEESGGEPEDDGQVLPPELLMSLLDLELSPSATGEFWAGFERRAVAGVPNRQAFLQALEECLSRDEPEEVSTMEECPTCSTKLLPGRAAKVHMDRCAAEQTWVSSCVDDAVSAASKLPPPPPPPPPPKARSRAAAAEKVRSVEAAEEAREEKQEETALERMARIKAEARGRAVAAEKVRSVEAAEGAREERREETALERMARIKAEAKERRQAAAAAKR